MIPVIEYNYGDLTALTKKMTPSTIPETSELPSEMVHLEFRDSLRHGAVKRESWGQITEREERCERPRTYQQIGKPAEAAEQQLDRHSFIFNAAFLPIYLS